VNRLSYKMHAWFLLLGIWAGTAGHGRGQLVPTFERRVCTASADVALTLGLGL